MDRAEAIRRDGILRAFFEGKDWDENEEFVLKRDLIRRSRELLPAFPFLVDDEWEVVSGMTNLGRGDLLFTDGSGNVAVVEVKFIDTGRSGSTARAKRTDSRKKVMEQARTYADHVRFRYPGVGEVRAFAYTNEQPERVTDASLRFDFLAR
jgi:hypothetical protein